MIFYLGTHKASWLARAGVPLFVSRRTLAPMKRLPRAIAPWALDSGGFTELALYGRWTVTPRVYAAEVRRIMRGVGMMQWAAPQDWMCEPSILKKTGLTVRQHQLRTIANYLRLRRIAPDVPWIPVLQGWTLGDYWHHADDYARVGVDLTALPVVGVGTVCRRQGSAFAVRLFASLRASGIRCHGFGVKTLGLARTDALGSADSLAWSMHARRRPPIAGHTHKNCANCLEYALDWRSSLLSTLEAA